ncbi:MAG: glycosyltransferase family 4 protein [bacterium]
MKVLHLNTFDIEGGAARAAWRLHQGLRELGTDSRMLVQTKTSGDETVCERDTELARWLGKFRPYMEIVPLIMYRSRPSTHWATEWTPTRVIQQILALKPDIIHLHWVCRGFMSITDIGKLPAPVVWTLHDSWAFTGGCHVPGSCTLYKKQCGMCPQLASTQADDLSRWVWTQKAKHWAHTPFTIVTPSHWLADCARNSSLLKSCRTEVIPNGIDTTIYRPVPRHEARAALALPQDRKLVLISAMNATLDTNKGFRYLEAGLQQLAAAGWKDKIELLVVGQAAPSTPVNAGVPIRFLGILKDEDAMRQVYSAADVTVLSSIQENLPNSIMESMACGTPVVAFNIGGIPQLIDHNVNGYLAAPFEASDLAAGIQMVLSDDDNRARLSAMALKKIITTFDTRIITRQYQALYEKVRIQGPEFRIQNSEFNVGGALRAATGSPGCST